MTVNRPPESEWAGILEHVAQATEFDLTDCIVVLGFQAADWVGAARFEGRAARECEGFAHAVASLASRFPAGSTVVLVSYARTERTFGEALSAAVVALERAGVGVRELLWQSERHWGSYLSNQRHLRNRRSPQRVQEPSRALNTSVPFVHAIEVQLALQSASSVPVCALVDAIEGVLDDSASASHILRVVLAVRQPRERDRVLMQWAWGVHADTLEPSLMIGRGRTPTDPLRIAQAVAACARFQLLSAPERPAFLTIEAWLRWSIGQSSRARQCLEQARSEDPRYRLAELLLEMIVAGRIPDWAFAAS